MGDLRLPIGGRVIAVLADQYVREQRQCCQATIDKPFRRAGVGDRVAGSAGVFRTRGTHYVKLRRHPVEHLADALAKMKSTATIAAEPAVDVEQNVLSWQVIRRRSASWLRRLVFRSGHRLRFRAPISPSRSFRPRGSRSGLMRSELRPSACVAAKR